MTPSELRYITAANIAERALSWAHLSDEEVADHCACFTFTIELLKEIQRGALPLDVVIATLSVITEQMAQSRKPARRKGGAK